MTPQKFRDLVWKHYKEQGRHALPWRKTQDPYKILVSELMLQQTQVDRVIPYFTAWMKKYPTADALSKASLADVLISWQGLGYNRRAKMLHQGAQKVVKEYAGKMPKTVSELEALPGVGSYTARAVAAFAYNQDVAFIETNVRTAVLHHFFPEKEGVSDGDILAVVTKVLPKGKSREWYGALMDYGSHLKRNGVRTNAQSKGYAKQAAFKGSGREVRGAILRTLSAKGTTRAQLLKLFPTERASQIQEQITKLLTEGLMQKKGRVFSLPT